MLSRMTIRSRLLVVAAIPAAAVSVSMLLLRSGAPAGASGPATVVAAAGILVTVVVALMVARTITIPLHRLGEAAERASHLQSLVEALRRPSGDDRALALTPVGLPRGGEIGSVARAFDDFQGAAARLAVGQAALLNKTVAEKGTVEVFVNLARRMQGLIDHQIELLDGLEAEEQDPDALESLFRLDQLATRVRRNAESLLTLAGAASARSWERPLAMSDVIRAGMAEVEDIGRVDLVMDDSAAMLGNVAADAAHLLSELLENATRWSPPDTRVVVTGTPAAGGYTVTIEDAGIGMAVDARAEANHILTGPPLAEATVARSLGLVVAGRLARRLGIGVRLASAGTGGIVATVLVPPGLMVAAEETLGLEDMAGGPARALPFALARQEKRARISSQRSRGRRPSPGAVQAEATITQPPESRWTEEPAAPELPSRWIEPPTEPAPAGPGPAETAWPAAATEWSPADPEPSPAGQEWLPSEPEWPTSPAPSQWQADTQWPAGTAAADGPGPEGGWSVASEPEWTAALRAEADSDPAPATEWPSPVARVPAPSPPEPPASIRPMPAVRPARFASSSRPLAGAAPPGPEPLSPEAKEDEFRRHLERATAAGLVRRVPKASLPKDTGGGANRVPKTVGELPVGERLPEDVRSLLSSYRSGVERGRADGPEADQRTTTPQEQP